MERRNFLGKFAAGAAAAGIAATALPTEAQTFSIAAERNSLKAADFGAMGNGLADDTAAIQRAIDEAHRIGGATVSLEGKSGRVFKCAGALNLDDKRCVRLSGNAGPSSGEMSQLLFTGKSGPFISLRSSFSVTLEQLRIAAAGRITGPLVATGHSNAKADTMYLLIDRCMFVAEAKAVDNFLELALCITSTVRSSQFIGAAAAITGGTGGYSNAIQITETVFLLQGDVAIRNAGESWLISGCTFEPLADGRAGAIRQDKGKIAWGLTVIGCWMGDAEGSTGGCWIDLSAGPSLGASIIGNRMAPAGSSKQDTAIKIGPSNQGISIMGNRIEGPVCIDFVAPYTFGAAIVGNDLSGITPIANLGNAVQHFVAGQYTTQTFISGISNFGTGVFSGSGGGTRGSIQLIPQPQPTQAADGDMWLNDGGLFVKIGGRVRRVALE